MAYFKLEDIPIRHSDLNNFAAFQMIDTQRFKSFHYSSTIAIYASIVQFKKYLHILIIKLTVKQ